MPRRSTATLESPLGSLTITRRTYHLDSVTPLFQTLDPSHRRRLLELARQTLEARFAGAPPPTPGEDLGPLTEVRGAFVTLSLGRQLRGCIGHVVGIEPLWRTVRDNAILAAFRDPRFPPLDADELPRVEIEISALTPLREIRSLDEIEIGRDGLMVVRGAARGLLLPQVAEDLGWDVQTFVRHTCRKAGLAPDCWGHPDARWYAFSAEVFSESGR